MDDKLSRTLASLPRERAGADFTAGVLRRLEAPRLPQRRLAPARWPLLAAAAVLLLVAGLGAREWWHLHQRQRVIARLDALEAERVELVAELDALRRLSAQAQPVVYLGGNDEVDLVLDVARLQRVGYSPRRHPDQGLSDERPGGFPAAAMPRPILPRPPAIDHQAVRFDQPNQRIIY